MKISRFVEIIIAYVLCFCCLVTSVNAKPLSTNQVEKIFLEALQLVQNDEYNALFKRFYGSNYLYKEKQIKDKYSFDKDALANRLKEHNDSQKKVYFSIKYPGEAILLSGDEIAILSAAYYSLTRFIAFVGQSLPKNTTVQIIEKKYKGDSVRLVFKAIYPVGDEPIVVKNEFSYDGYNGVDYNHGTKQPTLYKLGPDLINSKQYYDQALEAYKLDYPESSDFPDFERVKEAIFFAESNDDNIPNLAIYSITGVNGYSYKNDGL